MRSFLSLILIAIITVALGAVALWQFRDGNLHRVLGIPPVAVGERIYPELNPQDAVSIFLRSGGIQAHFVKTADGWQATKPWQDRMDGRAAHAIINFAHATVAEDLVERGKLDPEEAGLGAGNVEVHIKNAAGATLAYFRLGHRTPWQHLEKSEGAKPIPTMYLLPLERGRKSHVYAATGDILPLFKDGFKFLRDHRPFYFNPMTLQKMRLKTNQGELTLGRESPSSAWRIIKPLDLATNPEAVRNLLEGLFELQALKLSERSDVTMPSDRPSADGMEIGITPFGSEQETRLEIFPPQESSSRTTQAMVSDRPNTIFSLPLKAEPDAVSISVLPLTVNELREATLTNLNIASIRGIAIESISAPTILVSRQPPSPWIMTANGKEQEANEQRLYELLKAATETRAISFVTDAAPQDLSPWGLDRPIMTLVFLAENNQALTIFFGLDNSGNLFAKRKDSSTIMELAIDFLDKIAVRPHEWRHARLATFSRVDFSNLIRKQGDEESLKLGYDFMDDSWQAFQTDENVTSKLDPLRANFLLSALENLQVSSWLSPLDETAVSALKEPFLTFEITQRTVDEFGDRTGEKTYIIIIGVDRESGEFYGQKSSEDSYFKLSEETVLKLSVPLLDE